MKTIETFTGNNDQIRLAQSFLKWAKTNCRWLYATIITQGNELRHFDSVRVLRNMNINGCTIANTIERENLIPSFQNWLDSLSEEMIAVFYNDCHNFYTAAGYKIAKALKI